MPPLEMLDATMMAPSLELAMARQGSLPALATSHVALVGFRNIPVTDCPGFCAICQPPLYGPATRTTSPVKSTLLVGSVTVVVPVLSSR